MSGWHLIYRLGHLDGHVKANECEEVLKELVIKKQKLKPKQTSNPDINIGANNNLKTPNGREVIL
ncbi:hypothetical protein KBC31_03265 [Candidatus Saccharibacteria bacterium]|jgi:hypothetical protein|nr:hypothetical protein [Candidatus Saccharibacteria bacterium]